MPKKLHRALVAGAMLGVAFIVQAQSVHDHNMRQHPSIAATAQDDRTIVPFSEEMRLHTLANMRDHLLALQQIQDALAKEQYEEAGDIAEQRLGMTALTLHGAPERAKYMPEAMQNIGSEMHRSASRLAIVAKDASVTGDVKPALAALARVTQQCVACHSSYRVR